MSASAAKWIRDGFQELREHLIRLEALVEGLKQTMGTHISDGVKVEAQDSKRYEDMDTRLKALEKDASEMEGSLKVWKLLGGGLGVLLIGLIGWMFKMIWTVKP